MRGNLAAEETRDLFGFHAQHRSPGELFIERPKRDGGAEHQIGGIFHLHQAPVVGLAEHVEHRAALCGIAIEHTVQQVGREPVCQFLRAEPVVNPDKGIVGGGEADALCRQLPGQPAMTVAVELMEEPGHPGCVADRRKCPGYHHPIVAGQDPGNPVVIAIHKCACHSTLDCRGVGSGCYILFGSGSAGLGQEAVAVA